MFHNVYIYLPEVQASQPAFMLRLQPAKRPSVNKILGMPFIKQHMHATLAETRYDLNPSSKPAFMLRLQPAKRPSLN